MKRFVRPDDDAPLELPPLLRELQPTLNSLGQPVYLVGGLVRDILLAIGGNDLDLAVAERGIRTAFKLGNALKAPAYILDKERDVGRVVLSETVIDVARFRGDSLEADLRDRDFTINAIALPLRGKCVADLVDPTGGIADLACGLVRQASPTALLDDPLRALRAIRLALQLGYMIEAETWQMVVAAGSSLMNCSPERRRDELVKLFGLPSPGVGLKKLAEAGLQSHLLPGLASGTAALLNTVALLQAGVVNGIGDDGRCSQLVQALGDDRVVLLAHWDRPVDGGHHGTLLLRLAALLHAQSVAVTGDPVQTLSAYRFSNEVVRYVRTVVQAQTRLLALRGHGDLTRRQIYRYFNGVGPAGLDIAILTLAKLYNEQDPDWVDFTVLVATLVHAFAHDHRTVIKPLPLIRGDELMQALSLAAGPEIGRLLSLIEEAQAAGDIQTKEEALALARAS